MEKDAKNPELMPLESTSCESSIKTFKKDIIDYLQKLESLNSKLNPIMIDNQPEINWMMRPYIIDFLVELHRFFKLNEETLFLACFIADKYCSKRIVYKKHYQLLIATSLWIAAKFKDKKTRIPTLKELCLLCHQLYDSKIFLQMEKHILTTLEWTIGNLVSTFDMFQVILSTSSEKSIPKHPQLSGLASFFCDLSLYQRNYLCYSSSTKAIASLILASRILSLDNFPDFLVQLMTFCPIKNDIEFNNPNLYNNDFHDLCDTDSTCDGYDNCDEISQQNNLSSIICKQKIDDIRNCLYLFLKDVFIKKLNGSKESISHILLKKYKSVSIGHLLDSYRLKNGELFDQLCSLKSTLKQCQSNRHSDLSSSQLQDSIYCCLDKFAGFRIPNDTLDFSLIDENLLFSSPLNPLSVSPMANEFDAPRCADRKPSNSSYLQSSSSAASFEINGSTTPFISHYSSFQSNAFPPTPLSANSCFSGRPRLSVSSSASSLSYTSNSTVSPAGLLKKSFRSNSRNSSSNFQPALSRKSSAQSEIFELINK